MQGAVASSRTEGDHVRKELRISKRDPLLPNQSWELNLIGKGGFAANCGGPVQWVLADQNCSTWSLCFRASCWTGSHSQWCWWAEAGPQHDEHWGTGNTHWAFHILLQQCKRSKKKHTRIKKRMPFFHYAMQWPSGFFSWQSLILHRLAKEKYLQGPALIS